MKIKEVLSALERFAPLPLQESYDNAGLQVGLTEEWDVSGALLCLDVTEPVLDEALQRGCNLIVSHHPLIFRKLSQISDRDEVQRVVRRAIKNDVAIISMHTNLDNARGGVNFKMAEKLGLRDVDFFTPQRTVDDVVGASGVMGRLPEELSAEQFIGLLKQTFRADCVMTNELLQRPISRVALCGGAGAFLLSDAIAAGADAFVTGEMGYHDYFGHAQQLQIAVIGHYQSEQYTSELLQDIIRTACPGIRTHITTVNTNPIKYHV